MDKAERIAALRHLRRNDIAKIARASGLNIVNVSRWIHGTVNKSSCEPFFTAMVKMRKAEEAESIESMLSDNSQPTPKSSL